MSIGTLNQHKQAFIETYNLNSGLNVIRTFKSPDCCITLLGGKKLFIAGTPMGYQFPAGQNGFMKCGPSVPFAGRLQFFGASKLSQKQAFSEKEACKTNHNPGLFIKLGGKAAKPDPIAFGIYDFEKTPGM